MNDRRKHLRVVSGDRRREWEQILMRSRQMLEAGREGRWDEVTTIARERGEEVERFFRVPAAAYEAEWLVDGIRHVLDLDHRLLQLAQAGRDESAAAVVQLDRGRRARAAYRCCGPGG